MEENKKKKKSTCGRPTRYQEIFNSQAEKLCKLGATDKDLADFFGVAEQTINNWKNKYPSFLESIKEAKDDLDTRVERSLFERATGYSHPEDKIFNANGEPLVVPTIKHYAPDPTSIIFWLKNRQPDKWRDKQEVDLRGHLKTEEVKSVSLDDLESQIIEESPREE